MSKKTCKYQGCIYHSPQARSFCCVACRMDYNDTLPTKDAMAKKKKLRSFPKPPIPAKRTEPDDESLVRLEKLDDGSGDGRNLGDTYRAISIESGDEEGEELGVFRPVEGVEDKIEYYLSASTDYQRQLSPAELKELAAHAERLTQEANKDPWARRVEALSARNVWFVGPVSARIWYDDAAVHDQPWMVALFPVGRPRGRRGEHVSATGRTLEEAFENATSLVEEQ